MADKARELELCERAAEGILEQCAKSLQRDAGEARVRLLQFVHHAPEAARLHPAHHILYQAHVALAVACHAVGALDERVAHLCAALDALLSWELAVASLGPSQQVP
jgi:hypothetical protein